MKNWILGCLVALFAIAAGTVEAQAVLDKGKIAYDVTIDGDMDEAQKEQMKAYIPTLTVYFSDDMTVSSNSVMNGMAVTNTYFPAGGEVTMLMNMMGQKIKIETSRDELGEMGEREITANDFEIQKMEGETKTIAGYECTKYVLSPKEGDGTEGEVVLYVTDRIDADNSTVQYMDFGEWLDGFPLEYSFNNQGMEMTVTATEVSSEVPEDIFVMDDTGYNTMTMDQFMESMGQAGGK